MKPNYSEVPANLSRNPATANDMALSFSSTHLPQCRTLKYQYSKQRYLCCILVVFQIILYDVTTNMIKI